MIRTAFTSLGCAVRHAASKSNIVESRWGRGNFMSTRLRFSSFESASSIRAAPTDSNVNENSLLELDSVNGNRKGRSKRRMNTPNSKGNKSSTASKNQAFYDDRWVKNFQNLRSFMEQSNRNDVANTSLPEDKRLRAWMSRQKLEYRKKCNGQPTMMTDQRIELLKSIGFSFQALSKRSWDNVYEQLCDYVARNHDFPNEYIDGDAEGQRLFHWCQRQRVNYTYYRLKGKSRRSTLMTEERITKLDQINFSWSLRDVFWEEKYQELKDYHQHHNDCLVPAAYVSNMSLAKWVERQRKQYLLLKQGKPSGLTEPRLALLNELDFVWDASEHKWRQKYKELAEYQRNNGHGVMPRKNDPDMAPLFRWLVYQKNTHRKWTMGEKSSLTPERIALLEQAGVQWSDK